jgi:uncharacterized protein HemX
MLNSKPDFNQNVSNTGANSKWPVKLTIAASILLMAFCIYQIQKMDRLAKKFAQKEIEWQTRYQGYEEKLRLNENYQKQQIEKITLLEQKNSDLQNKQYENDVHLAEFEVLKDTDQILLMQIKPVLYQASQQLKFQQNIEQTLFILQDVQQRLSELENSKWRTLYQSIEKDINILRQADSFDQNRWLSKLDQLKQLSNQITFNHEAMDMANASISTPSGETYEKSAWANIKAELASLFRIQKINSEEMLSNEQAWFYRQKIDLYLKQMRFLITNQQLQDFAGIILEIDKMTRDKMLQTPKNQAFLELLTEFKLLAPTQKLNIDQSIQALEQLKKS